MRGLAITILFMIATVLLDAAEKIAAPGTRSEPARALFEASEKIAALATRLMTDAEREEMERVEP